MPSPLAGGVLGEADADLVEGHRAEAEAAALTSVLVAAPGSRPCEWP
ncbi:hypothetical protein [Methylobacterium indicum]